MSDSPTPNLIEQITQHLPTLSADELQTVHDFVEFLLWKRQPAAAPAPHPKSAEARAIERLGDSDDPTKWITVMEIGDEIDEAALERLDQWLVDRGYKKPVSN